MSTESNKEISSEHESQEEIGGNENKLEQEKCRNKDIYHANKGRKISKSRGGTKNGRGKDFYYRHFVLRNRES